MSDEAFKALQKDVSQKKRIATEWASQIHDLVEDRLLSDYDALPELALRTQQACQAWAEAKARLDQASAG
ncbi:MAG TPA: CCE_0567 family metalloprotein [Pseudomonas sp.]|nr:CCE_0567 family metalloprotein [Pseudomonas sp.]